MAFLKNLKDGILSEDKVIKIKRAFQTSSCVATAIRVIADNENRSPSYTDVTNEMILLEIESVIIDRLKRHAENIAPIIDGVKVITYPSLVGFVPNLLDNTLDASTNETLKKLFYVFFKDLQGKIGNVEAEWNMITNEQIITVLETAIKDMVRKVDEIDRVKSGLLTTITYTNLDE